jgi:hypothetical protein
VVVHNGGRADTGCVLVERGEGLRVRVVDPSSGPGFDVRALLTTLTEGYDRVSMSGVRGELLDRQAQAIGLPVIKVWIPPQCTNEVYEHRMASTFASPKFQGIGHVAFADLFLEDIRAYREGRLVQAGKRGVFPI